MSQGTALVGSSKGNVAVDYVWLCGAHVYKGDGAYEQGMVPGSGECNRCGCRPADVVFTADVEDPRLGGWGPIEAKAGVGLDLVPRFIWDVNRYYRRLGVDPRCSKREIREAYQRANGQESPELTAIVKFLLDDEQRWRYDNLPIGRINIDDQIMNTIRIAESRMASEKIARGEASLAEMQHLFLNTEEPDETVLDGGGDEDQDDVPPRSSGFNWGHYVWRSGCEDFRRLAEWQGALAAAIGEQRGDISFAVGFVGHADVPFDVTVVGYRVVAFLNDKQPISEDAVAEAATRVVQLKGVTDAQLPQGSRGGP